MNPWPAHVATAQLLTRAARILDNFALDELDRKRARLLHALANVPQGNSEASFREALAAAGVLEGEIEAEVDALHAVAIARALAVAPDTTPPEPPSPEENAA